MRFREIHEARQGSLYHGTGPATARDIIVDDTIDANTHQPRENIRGVSLTRSLRVARRFGEVVLELDQQKLSHDYPIRPLDYWGYSPEVPNRRRGSYAEEEEFIPRSILNVHRYLRAIHVSDAAARYMSRFEDFFDPLIGHPLMVRMPQTV